MVSTPQKRFGAWDAEELLHTGEAHVASLMRRARRLGYPEQRRSALDFGCGVGRLTQALAPHFDECVGVDISEEMLSEARRLSADVPGVRFLLNDDADLRQFADGSFDLVFSHIVLQHVPDRAGVLSYISEFVRVLAPGGLIAFQLPSRIALRHRVQPHRRVWRMLRRLGVSPARLYGMGLQPIHMGGAPVDEVASALEHGGGRVLVVDTNLVRGGNESSRYWVTREEHSASPAFQVPPRSSVLRTTVRKVMRPGAKEIERLRGELAESARLLERERQRSKHWKEAADRRRGEVRRWKGKTAHSKESAKRWKAQVRALNAVSSATEQVSAPAAGTHEVPVRSTSSSPTSESETSTR